MAIGEEVRKNMSWALKHKDEINESHSNKHVVVNDQQIVFSSTDECEARTYQQKHPDSVLYGIKPKDSPPDHLYFPR